MSEINASLSALDDQITKLTELKSKCEQVSTTAIAAEGSGTTNMVLQTLDKEYTEVKNAITELIGNSIQFFTNVKLSLMEADVESSAQFEKEVGAK